MTSAPPAANGGNTDQKDREQLRTLLDPDAGPPRDRIRQMLQLGADRYGVSLGLLVQVDPAGDQYTIDEVSTSRPDLTGGLTGDLVSTYCRMVVAEQAPLVLEKTAGMGGGDASAHRSTLLSTYIGAAVEVDGAAYGTVCFVDQDPNAASFDEADRSFLDRLARAVGQVLAQRTEAEAPARSGPAQALSVVERRYRTALTHSPVVFAKVDTDLRYEWICNPHADFDPAAVVGKRDDELDAGPGIEQLVDLKRRTLEQGEQIREEILFERSDGLNVYDVTATPLREGEGTAVTGLITASLNITERKEAERALRRNQERLSMAIEGGNIGTWDWDLETDTVIFNRQWAEMLGYSRDELDFHFSTWEDLVHPDDLPRAMEVLGEYVDGERDTFAPEIRMRTKSGDWKWIQTIGKVVDRDETGELTRAAGIHLDINDRKEAERALRKSERRFRRVFENAAIGIVIANEDGRLLQVNPAFRSMLAYGADELRGRRFPDITHPEDLAPSRTLFEELTEGKRDRFQLEKRYIRRDGEPFWGRLTASLLELGERRQVVALVEDIDAEKQYREQLRKAKEEAEDAARLKSVMLANMSHEVRTPLTSMIGFSGILADRLEGRAAKLARLIRKSGQRLEETMEAVLELSQLEAGSYTLDRETLRLGGLIRRIVDEFELQAEEAGVTIHVEGGDDPVEAYADETAVRRVLSNLLDNAIKFTPDGGTIWIRGFTEEGEAVVEVEDTGVGIAEEALPDVFRAFKQESEGLTREFEGAGLGLSIVKELVDALGGRIDVATEKEEGTCMSVRLPRTKRSAS